MKIPQVLEHLEAEQESYNRRTADFYSKLSPEDKAKLDAIDKSNKILTEAGLPYMLFTQLPTEWDLSIKCIWQWNNMREMIKWDNAGKPKGELVKDIHCGIYYYFFFNYFVPFHCVESESFEQKWLKFVHYLYHCIAMESNRLSPTKE